uniref:AKNA domain containing 1 n=1 Tax=Rousettus aegyptiacus TaxID=9407 RepID=A0A7J8BC86_ROUAE|nr:AKNA domain containing 1 [Rousettus aegyptiacus]
MRTRRSIVTTENIKAKDKGQRSGCTYMDKADFSEDTTLEQQDDLPDDEGFSQVKLYSDHNFTSKNDTLDVSDKISTVDDPQEDATHKETCRNRETALMLDGMTENVEKTYDKEKRCTTNLHVPANQGDLSKSNISNILLHHLSKEEFFKGQGINCETLPETSNGDSSDEAVLKNIILRYVKNSWPNQPTPELADQLNPRRDGENKNKPSRSPTTAVGSSPAGEEPVAAGDGGHPENSTLLTEAKSPRDNQKSGQGQTPQKQQTEKARSGNGFKCDHGQVSHRFSEFSKVLEKLQGRLELLGQEFLTKKEKHLTLKQQVYKHEPPAASDFDPERKVESEIFKLEMLLKDVKEKIEESEQTSAQSLPLSSPTILDELAPTTSPPSNEEDPSKASGKQKHAETTSRSCAFCHQICEWKQKLEQKGHRRINCGRFPIVLQEKARHPSSILSLETGHSCCFSPAAGLRSNKCDTCSTESHRSPRVCHEEPLKEFHYRYDTLGQNYLNHSERRAFVPLHFLNENKYSSPSCSKPKWICSQRANSKSSQDEHEPVPGKISGSKNLSNFSGIEEMKSEVLNLSLDYALRTATILKETTDQMIKTIAEDLAKAQRWRNQMKY